MENRTFLLVLFWSLGFASSSGEDMKKDVDLVSLLRTVQRGLLVRDEPFVNDRRFEMNSIREWSPLEVRRDTTRAPGPLVLTKDGQIQGTTVDRAHVFYGVPYADPPTGAYRWKPPRPVTPWPHVYDASFPRAACMQACTGPARDECPQKVSEDCLYLNVFVPLDVDFRSPLQRPLPVLLWVHGGDFIAGSASKPLYDGRFVSNLTHTVVVSVEYRLGAFGFLVSGREPHSSATGNYGILDQQAAFLWVQRNIALFGGNPSKVTIFGESAGAQSVGVHLTVQSSGPLFQRAVLQSLPFSIPLKTRHDALKLGKDFAEQTNCSVSDFVCLLSLPEQDVLTAQMKTSSKLVNPFRFLELFETWGPHLDGELIKEQTLTAFHKGHWQKEKPLLLGTTSEEGVIFVYGVFTKPVSVVEATVYITAIFKQHTLRVLHRYLPLYRGADRREMLAQIVTDYVFLCPSRRSARAGVAAGTNVWMYIFDHAPSDQRVWSGLTFCYQRACHGAELPLLFGSAAVANFTLSPPERLLSNQMMCHWGAFAHAGDPNPPAPQTASCRQQRPPAWPPYSDTSGWLVMNLTTHSHAQVGTRSHVCDFWDQLGVYY